MSLLMILDSSVRKNTNFFVLDATAERHSRRGADIKPHLYDIWIDALVETVRNCDDEFTAETATLWRRALEPAVDYLVERY